MPKGAENDVAVWKMNVIKWKNC